MPEIQKYVEPIRLETDRLGLVLVQMLTQYDDETYLDLQNTNLDYWKEFGNTIDQTVDEVTARRLEHGDGRFGIWLEDRLIGMVGYSTRRNKEEAEIGILLDKDAAGQGYASAAVKALTEFAKTRFNRVYAEVDPDNAPSIALLSRSGYQTTGETVEREWGQALVFEAPK